MLSIYLGNGRHVHFTAPCHGAAAARMEWAPAWSVERAGDRALDRDQPLARGFAQARHSPKEIHRVRMFWIAQDFAYRSIFHDLPEVHDRNSIGNLGDDSKIVGNEHDSHPEVLLQAAHEVQDLSLDRHVERRRRFIGDQ